jgi:glyceraldehyde 3-phosphate dehydrogenase (phosphorylating)
MRVAINGFGRIGRLVLRAAQGDPRCEIVAVNDVTDAATLGHLLKYDSVHGVFDKPVTVEDGALVVDGRRVRALAEKDPKQLPWREMEIDVVVESTGLFTGREKAGLHLEAGARRVIISAPSKDADVTIALGVNQDTYDPSRHKIVSNASCTTNCLAPVVKVLHDGWRLRRGWMTTIHAYTNDQRILDLPHKDLRRARAAALNQIPTTTGAARAIGLVIPELKGKLDGISMRVPVPNGSVVDLVAELEKNATREDLNRAFREAAEGPLRGILEYSEEDLVSSDIIGNPHSSIVDGKLTAVMDGNLIKVLSWYDNEWGFSKRVVELIHLFGSRT